MPDFQPVKYLNILKKTLTNIRLRIIIQFAVRTRMFVQEVYIWIKISGSKLTSSIKRQKS